VANVKLVILVMIEELALRELETLDEFVDDGGDALLRHRREGRSGLGMRILENYPQAGAVGLVVAGANGAVSWVSSRGSGAECVKSRLAFSGECA